MKLSVKILVTTAGILIALFVTGMVLLRQDVQYINEQAALTNRYEEVDVGEFDELVFGATWDVRIRQSKNHKVEVMVPEGSGLLPDLELKEGTLYFKIDTATLNTPNPVMFAKIGVPRLDYIKASSGSRVELHRFETDSLSITIEKGGTFKSYENVIEYILYKSQGESVFEWIDDPFS